MLDFQFNATSAKFSVSSLLSRRKKNGKRAREGGRSEAIVCESSSSIDDADDDDADDDDRGRKKKKLPHRLWVEQLAVWPDSVLIAELFWLRLRGNE